MTTLDKKRPFVRFNKDWHQKLSEIIDPSKPVEVYRNLNVKDGGVPVWSVRQDGKVRAHCAYIVLKNVEFIVRQKGREKVLQSGRKNVHAFVKGYLCTASEMGYCELVAVNYRPVLFGHFYETKTHNPVFKAKYVDMMADDLGGLCDRILVGYNQ